MNPNSNTAFCMLGTIGTIATSALMVLPILVGAYVDYLGFSEDTAGRISSINLAGIAVMVLVASLNIRRWPLEKVAGYGLAAMVVFDILTLYFHSLLPFSILRFLSGMAGGATMAAVSAAIARSAQTDKGYGIYIGLQFVIPAFGLYFFPGLLPEIGFNGIMIILIVLQVAVLLMVPILKNYPVPVSAGNGDTAAEKNVMSLIFRGPAFLAIIGFCIYGVANGGIWAYAERIGLTVGLDGEGIGSIIAVSNIFALVGAFCVIWLQNKFGHIRPLVIGVALQFIAMLVLIYATSATDYAVGIILFQAAWAFTWPYFLSIQADIDSTGTIVLAGSFANMMGNSAGPALAAFFVGSGNGYDAALWMCSGLFFASVIPMMAIYSLASKRATSAHPA